jgi:hypothetical protein
VEVLGAVISDDVRLLWFLVLSGGNANNASSAGVFNLNANNTSSNSNVNIGSRTTYWFYVK